MSRGGEGERRGTGETFSAATGMRYFMTTHSWEMSLCKGRGEGEDRKPPSRFSAVQNPRLSPLRRRIALAQKNPRAFRRILLFFFFGLAALAFAPRDDFQPEFSASFSRVRMYRGGRR